MQKMYDVCRFVGCQDTFPFMVVRQLLGGTRPDDLAILRVALTNLKAAGLTVRGVISI